MQDMTDSLHEVAKDCGGLVSVAVRDISRGSSFGMNEDAVVSSASVIKVPMLVEAMRQARDGLLSLETQYVLSDDARVDGSGVMRYLHTGTVLTLQDLLTLMVIVSDNTATNMLIDILGIDSVNATLRSLGCAQTTLQRKMYDWAAIDRGQDNVCTAAEIAGLLARIATDQAVGPGWDAKAMEILRHQQDCGKLGLMLPEGVKLANKTGSREGIMHDCGIVTSGDLRYSIAVFTRDARSPGEAVLAIARVSRIVYDSLARGIIEQ